MIDLTFHLVKLNNNFINEYQIYKIKSQNTTNDFKCVYFSELVKTLYTNWEQTNCTAEKFTDIANSMSNFVHTSTPQVGKKIMDEFADFYDNIVSRSNIQENFEDETICLKGGTFKDLASEGSLLVISNINILQNFCNEKERTQLCINRYFLFDISRHLNDTLKRIVVAKC